MVMDILSGSIIHPWALLICCRQESFKKVSAEQIHQKTQLIHRGSARLRIGRKAKVWACGRTAPLQPVSGKSSRQQHLNPRRHLTKFERNTSGLMHAIWTF